MIEELQKLVDKFEQEIIEETIDKIAEWEWWEESAEHYKKLLLKK